jgi:hypothetical protein
MKKKKSIGKTWKDGTKDGIAHIFKIIFVFLQP